MSHLKFTALLAATIGISQVAVASSDTGTLLVGETISTICSGPTRVPLPYFLGFNSTSPAAGSYSPTGLTGGKAVVALFDYLSCGTLSEMSISGFSANPGQSWLSSVTCGSVTNLASTATFFYSGGTASWLWKDRFGFFSKNGSNVSCTIVHD